MSNYCRACGKATHICRDYDCKAKARKHQYLKKVGETVSNVPHLILVDVVVGFIQSARFGIDARRGLLEDLRRLQIKDAEYQVYPNKYLSEYQVRTIRKLGLVDYLPIVLEVGSDTLGTVRDIYDAVTPVVKGIGVDLDTNPTKKMLGVFSAMLLLGGYTFKDSRTAENGSRKILKAVPGTEMMTLDDRTAMAMERCKVMGLIKDKNSNEMIDAIVYNLI